MIALEGCETHHTAHCNTLQHTATHCNTLQHTSSKSSHFHDRYHFHDHYRCSLTFPWDSIHLSLDLCLIYVCSTEIHVHMCSTHLSIINICLLRVVHIFASNVYACLIYVCNREIHVHMYSTHLSTANICLLSVVHIFASNLSACLIYVCNGEIDR